MKMTKRRTFLYVCLTLVAGMATCQAADNEGLLPYEPARKVTGTVRIVGDALGGLVKQLEAEFVKFHPGVKFVDNFVDSQIAVPALGLGVSDLGTAGGKVMKPGLYVFGDVYGYDPTEVIIATGAYESLGRTPAIGVYVNAKNPIDKLSMEQLDGIFGSERTGGWDGLTWQPEKARSASGDIRTWGQAGLKDAWSDRTITTYGWAFGGFASFMGRLLIHDSEKWNPNYRQYKRKSAVSKNALGSTVTTEQLLLDMSQDENSIGWTTVLWGSKEPRVKPVALARSQGGPYYLPTEENFRNRSYPLVRDIYIYLNRAPGMPADPKVEEFVRFVLSKDGQRVIEAEKVYYPLPAKFAREQLEKIN